MHMDTEPTTRLHDALLDAALARHEKMMAEARRIIDSGNERDVVLRLTGGLAVRHYAIDLEFAERDYSAIDPADLFLSKLQIVILNEKGVHDVITICKDVYVDFQPHPGVLDREHVAETCAGDWGPCIDVMNNIYMAQDMMTEHSKSLRWRLRSRIGKRLKWYNEIEEQFGGRSEDTAMAVRTKAGRAAGGAGEAG